MRSFQWCIVVATRTKTILQDRVLFYQQKEAVFEVILSTCSEFSQIGTPHFSLEGVGNTTVIMDTGQKIQESQEKVSTDNFCKPLSEAPVVSSTIAKLENIVKNLFDNGHIHI